MRTGIILLLVLAPAPLLAQEVSSFGGKTADAWSNLLAPDSPERFRAITELAEGGRDAVPVLRVLLGRGPAQRLGAMAAVIFMKRAGEEAEPELRKILDEGDDYMRYVAASALVSIARAGKEVVPALVWGLENGTEDQREMAAIHLRELGDEARGALPALVAALGDEEAHVREAAASALERVTPRTVEDAAKLVPHLDSEDPRVVRTAIVLLGVMGEVAREAVPGLLRHLRDPESRHRFAASEALGGIGAPAVPHLEAALDDERATVRVLAAHALVVRGDPPVAAVAVLARSLRGRRDTGRIAASDLAKLGPRAEPAIPQLVAALGEEDVLVATAAARAIGRIGSPRALAALATLLEKGTAGEQRLAALAAVEMGPGALPLLHALLPLTHRVSDALLSEASREAIRAMGVAAVPALVAIVEGDDAEACDQAAGALGAIGPQAEEAVPALIEAMARRPRDEIQACVFALMGIGAPAVAALAEALEHESATVRLGVARVLGRMGEPGAVAVPSLERAASADPDPEVRAAAAASLARVKPPDGSSLEELLERLAIGDLFVRRDAMRALTRLGAAAVPDLVRALERPDLRESVIEVLGEIGPAAREAVPAIARLVGNAYLRHTVMKALDSIGEGVVPALVEVLGHEDFRTRIAAARELGNMGAGAKEAIPALEKAAADEEEMVREAAIRALERIRGK